MLTESDLGCVTIIVHGATQVVLNTLMVGRIIHLGYVSDCGLFEASGGQCNHGSGPGKMIPCSGLTDLGEKPPWETYTSDILLNQCHTMMNSTMFLVGASRKAVLDIKPYPP